MRKSDVFPSPWIKAEDLGDDDVQLIIKSVDVEELTAPDGKKDRKPVASFKGQEKKLILSKTNWDRIEAQFGDDSDGWIGKTVTLYAEAEARSESGYAARVKVPKPKAVGGLAKPIAAPAIAAPVAAVAEDDIPS